MALPKPQHPFDWCTQLWNIGLGRRVQPAEDAWLVGPIGRAKEFAPEFLERLAQEQGLRVQRGRLGAGLLPDLQPLMAQLHPKVAHFYTSTSSYQLDVRAGWRRGFRFLGQLAASLFTRRINQFNLPEAGSEVSFQSEIVELVDAQGETVITIWLRSIRETKTMVFYGAYSMGEIPSGKQVVKSVFPLPEGNATVIFDTCPQTDGSLELQSRGRTYGDAGFYFLVQDRDGQLWKHFLPHFQQRIRVFPGEDSVVLAEHVISMRHLGLYRVDYTMRPVDSEPAR